MPISLTHVHRLTNCQLNITLSLLQGTAVTSSEVSMEVVFHVVTPVILWEDSVPHSRHLKPALSDGTALLETVFIN